jgi:hypothetical protein
MGGVITEDRMDKVIKNMIDDIGVENTFKMVGDYDLVESYLTDEDKIGYIKDQFIKINDGNYFTLGQISQSPIRYDGDEVDELHQIEGLGKGTATVVIYSSASPRKRHIKYESLPLEAIDKLFKMLLSQYI